MNDAPSLWLPPLAPRSVLFGAFTFFAVAVVASVLILASQPWIGVTLTADRNAPGVRVARVSPGGPSAGRLRPGDRILALSSDLKSVPLGPSSIQEEPDNAPTYEGYNEYFRHLGRINDIIANPIVTFVLEGGGTVSVRPRPARPLREIPFTFWLIHFFAVVGLLFGTGTWAFRRGRPYSRLLLISGLGFMIAACCMATYSSRELAFDISVFQRLAAVNHLGNTVLGWALLGLVWHFPRRFGRFPLAELSLAAAFLLWVNETVQFVEPPFHAYYVFQFISPYLAGMALAAFQWIRARGNPVGRASLLWLMLSITVGVGAALGFYMVPTLFGAPPLVSLWTGQMILLGLYVGFVLGVLRFRLFDLERWWFEIWLWFIGGALVVAVDVAIVFLLNVSPGKALGIAVLAVAWVYFPIRQFVWQRLAGYRKRAPEKYLTDILQQFFGSPSAAGFDTRWEKVLRGGFDPLSLTPVETAPPRRAELLDSGLTLLVPAIETEGAVKLTGRNRGKRLFDRDDLETANLIYSLGRQAVEINRLREQAKTAERRRIMRDLHDDVGAKLLTLAHSLKKREHADLAREAIRALRETIYAFDHSAVVTLEEALAEWRLEAIRRFEAEPRGLRWEPQSLRVNPALPPRHRINLGRIFREAVSNAIRHGEGTCEVRIREEETRLVLDVYNEKPATRFGAWKEGAGMAGIRTRAGEIGSTVEWAGMEDGRIRFSVSVDYNSF